MRAITKTVRSGLLGIFCLSYIGTLMAAEPLPPPAIGETYACTYRDGKDFDDKMKARDYMVDQIEKAGLTAVPGYHFTQIKGMAPVDTLWMDVHENMGAYGANADAWNESGISPAVGARFNAVEECTEGLSTLRWIHQREGYDAGANDSSIVVTLACQYQHGRGDDQLADLRNHMGSVMASFGEDGPNFSYQRVPITTNATFPDVFLSSGFSDMSHWARYASQLFGTDAGESMRNHMGMIVDCSLSLWRSRQVVTPDE